MMSTNSGTTVKFTPTTGQDSMVKSGITKEITTKLLCITAMGHYQSKSLEELRVEDYQANRKFPTAGSTSMSFGQTGGSIFGGGANTNTASGGLFGNNAQKPSIFGGTSTANTFGSGTSAFGGGTNNTAGSSIFGGSTAQKPSIFGSTSTSSPFGSTSTAPAFGTATNTNTGSLFGTNNAQKPSIFGGTSTTGAFGSTTSPAFGGGTTNSTPGNSLFGSNNAQKPSIFGGTSTTGAFGSTTTPAFGGATNNTATSSLFGTNNAQKPTLFGNASTTGAFGSTTTPAFGGAANNATTGSLFGTNNAQKPSIFGGTSTTGAFGSTTTPAFGGAANNATTGSLFGTNNAQKPSIFGGTSTTGAFGSTTTPAFGGVQSTASTVPQQQIVLAGDNSESAIRQAIIESQLSMYPYGDSQLLRSFSLKCNEDEAKNSVKSKLEEERVVNSYVPTKVTSISSPKTSTIESAKRLLHTGSTQRSSAFTYKPLVQRIGFGADDLNSSNDSRFTNLSSSTQHNSSFEIPKTNLFVPTLNSLTKTRNNPKRLETSSVAESITDSTSRSYNRSAARSTTPPPSINSPQPDDNLPRTLNFDLTSPMHHNSTVKSSVELNGSRQSIGDPNETIENGHQTIIEGPCGVRLSKRTYYTEPSIDELRNFVQDGNVHLADGFAIGRIGYGRIEWCGPISFSNVDLGEIVQFRRKEVQVYPDDTKKPEIGEGFNRKATISLESVWPINRATREEIRDPLSPEVQDFARQLERKCIKMDADFVDYDAENGVWTFRVRHFSKYGFYDDDEDELPPQPKRIKTVSKPLQVIQENAVKEQRAPLVDIAPKNLFIADLTETFNARMGIANDIMSFMYVTCHLNVNSIAFSEPTALRGQEPQAKEYSIREPKRTLNNFDLSDEIFSDPAFKKLLRIHNHPTVRRIGFGPSNNLSVIAIRDDEATTGISSNRVLINNIKLVPTIEAYLSNHLKTQKRETDFDKLIRTPALRMKPPSDFLRLVDGYLFNDLRNNFSLDVVNEKMERFCFAMCQDISDIKFEALQRRSFAAWLRTEFEDELNEKLASLKRGSTPTSPYAPVFYCLFYGFIERAAEVAAQNGLIQLSMFIGLYMSGVKVPSRLTSYSKLMFDGMKSLHNSDRYRRHVYALLAQIFFSKEHPAEDLRKNSMTPRFHLRDLSMNLSTGTSSLLE
ncbi:hypothetical protein M3Y98_00946300 [Aphelenchoides besseyi]|nr:hypothetical protein M3Y98_00946300 [Aphelenchoides besseyi]KAI6194529.1 hypothetical protein M3Y96_01134600 [Aphelenchoides besseyi]